MGARSRVVSVAIAGLAMAGGAGAQPEFVRLQGGDPAYPAFFDIQGDLLSWSSRSYSDRVLLTHVYRRRDGVWRLEAQLAGGDAYPGFTRIDGDRIVGWADHCDGGRIFRHNGQGWASEPIIRRNNLCITGEVGDVEGEWLVLRHVSWYGGKGLATVLRFQDGRWRWHSHLEAPGLGDYAGGFVQMEHDVLALGTVLDRFPYDNGPLTIFRREGERWRHEATLPDGGHPMDLDGGRIITNSGRLYSQAASGQWVLEFELPAIDRGQGYADLDGDNLVVLERYDGPHYSYYNGYRAALYRQDGAGWQRERVVYPATALGQGAPWPSIAFNVVAQPAFADGDIYVRSYLPFESEIIMGFSACRADFNGDGVADLLDLSAFLEAREGYRMNVDYDMDGDIGFPGVWDEGDFLEFMRALEEGC